MEQANVTGAAEAPATRPTFLTVLCVLSFIAAGFAIIGYVTLISVMGVVSASSELSDKMGAAMSSSSMPSAGMTWAYLVVGFITVLASLYGVIKMWKLQKMGFFIYAGASAVSMIMGMIYSGFSTMGVVFPILFIGLYYMNLKHMTK